LGFLERAILAASCWPAARTFRPLWMKAEASGGCEAATRRNDTGHVIEGLCALAAVFLDPGELPEKTCGAATGIARGYLIDE
jgi:hypothetical protein